MQASLIVGFGLIALTLVAVPGPDWAYVVGVGAPHGRVPAAVTGLLLGYVGITAVVAAGLGPLIAGSAVALTALTLGGAAYLLQLGVRLLRGAARAGFAPSTGSGPGSRWHYVVRGAGTSALNPKGLLLFVAVLPQFTRPGDAWPVPLQLAALGGVFILGCAAIYLPLGYGFGRLVAARPAAARATTTVAGVAMIAIALGLLAEHVVSALR